MPDYPKDSSGTLSEVEQQPIFIHGILPRSGTNFLWDLLLLHPDCAPPVEPVHEDLFLEHADELLAFASAARAAWDPRWGEFGPELPIRLHAALGGGLLAFLQVDRHRRLVAKNPSVRHLRRFFDFFPTACLVVLVRDGRAVAKSCMDTFGWTFERSARAWAAAADEILRFQQANAHRADRWQLVRYEDLIDDLDGQLLRLLRFAGLDPGRYDFATARNLPVRGSSAFFGAGRSSVNWNPVQKDATFAPKDRWRSWPAHRLDRFEWLAGDQLRAFGYEGTSQTRRPTAAAVGHVMLDVWWRGRRNATRMRRVVGDLVRPLRRHLRRR